MDTFMCCPKIDRIIHLSIPSSTPQTLSDIWPGGSILFAGALQNAPNSVQYGYSDGMQFPPFNAIDGPNTVLSVFVPGFVLPINFNFAEDVEVQGVKLKRCVRACACVLGRCA